MATFLTVRKRVNHLIGETNYNTKAKSAVIDSHINASIFDICDTFPFSWNMVTDDLTLAAGVADLPTDFNPKWRIYDARIVGVSTDNDVVFTEIPVENRNSFQNEAVYWITYDTTSGLHIFNTPTQSGTVAVYYYSVPAELTANSDICIVPDYEAVAYLAASKLYLGSPQNAPIKAEFKAEAQKRIQAMWSSDNMFGPTYIERSIAGDNLSQNG